MRIVRFIAFSTLFIIASCTSTKKVNTAVAPQPIEQQQQRIVEANNVTPQPNAAPLQRETPAKNENLSEAVLFGFNSSSKNLQENKTETVSTQPIAQTTTTTDFDKMSASFENKQSDNIQSFAQVKQLAASKQINLTNKQLKRLDKLDSKYHGDFNKFKKDAGGIFDTQTSKIIGAVGVVGLLLLIISGSGFGAFLLILSVGALLLKWLGIVSF